MWLEGFQEALSGYNLLYLTIGTVWGLFIGALPGLGPQFAVTLALPLTFGMPASSAIIMLSAIHASCAYGDSMASIMVNTPGGVGSIASCWDGFPMAQQGKAGFALGISTMGSFLGGLIGWLSMVIISPVLIYLAMKMGPPEYFMVALLALSFLSMGSQGKTIKGLILGGIGLLAAFIGRSPITGVIRFNLGSMYLEDGIPLVSVALGLFALPQAMIMSEKLGATISEAYEIKGGVWKGIVEVLRYPAVVIRGGLMGIFMGIMPALGISASSITSYMVEKKLATPEERETFGKGNPKGLIGPEVSKNSCLVGDLIPTITLGIPGSSVTALFLAALVIHGIQPGPDFFSKSTLPYTVFCGILLAQCMFFVAGSFFGGQISKIVMVPTVLLAPGITVMCFVGAYSGRHTLLDVWSMAIFGVLGYFLTKNKWPLACLILGFVLGEIFESNFNRTIIMGHNSFQATVRIFFTRPGSASLFILTLIAIMWPLIARLFSLGKGKEVVSVLADDED